MRDDRPERHPRLREDDRGVLSVAVPVGAFDGEPRRGRREDEPRAGAERDDGACLVGLGLALVGRRVAAIRRPASAVTSARTRRFMPLQFGTGSGFTPCVEAFAQPSSTPVGPSFVLTILNSTRRFFSHASSL